MPIQEISSTQLARWLADPERQPPQLLDVREAWELAVARLDGAVHIPLARLPSAFESLERDRPVVCLCHHGLRSFHAGLFLSRQDFAEIYNLTGGIDAWARDVNPALATY